MSDLLGAQQHGCCYDCKYPICGTTYYDNCGAYRLVYNYSYRGNCSYYTYDCPVPRDCNATWLLWLIICSITLCLCCCACIARKKRRAMQQ